MKVYVISSPKNRSLAGKLLSGIKNVKMIFGQSADQPGSSISMALKEKMESADAFLAMIDDEFSKSPFLNAELQLAEISTSGNSSRALISVILDNPDISFDTAGTLYIYCSSNSEHDFHKAQFILMQILQAYNVVHSKKANMIHRIRFNLHGISYATYFLSALSCLAIILSFIQRSTIFAILSLCIGIFVITLFERLDDIKLLINDKELETYSARLKQAIVPELINQQEQNGYGSEGSKKEIDALGRMMINLEDIKEFYIWSQKQAKDSFRLAKFMCIAGFCLMAASILLPIVFKLSLEMSVIPAIGGVITELIAVTSLSVYRASLSQLNYYHKSLHEDERFLSSVNLIGKFSTPAAQDNMLQEIIRSEIQMNLSGMHENAESDHSGTKKPRLGWHHSSTSPEQ